MGSEIHLYFDESVQVAVCEQVRLRGIDAVNVRDLGLLGDSDINHLNRATEMGCVLCTYDSDFLRLATDGIEHAGIIYAWQDETTIGDWIRALELLCGVYSAEDMVNRIEYL